MKMQTKRLEEAKHYLNFSAKHGVIDESDIEGKNDEELIKMADDMAGRADVAYESMKEEGYLDG